MPTSREITQAYQGPTFSPFGVLCEQHVDEVVDYWTKWQLAMDQPMYNKNSLSVLEGKLRENIAGMMSNANDSWTYISYLINEGVSGKVFAAAQIAFRSYNTSRVRELIERVSGNKELEQGLVSALAWMPQDIVHPWLRRFLKSKELNHKTIALRACRLRGEMPHKYLRHFLEQKDYTQNKDLYIQCLRIVGELKIHSEKSCLYSALNTHEPVRFWGIYSLVLLGEHKLAKQLAPYIFDDSEYQEKAIDLAFRVLSMNEAWELIAELKEQPRFRRQTLQALSCLGDPEALPWVLEQMKEPTLARVSGETFSNISGINLSANHLSIDTPYTNEELCQLDPDQTPQQLDLDEHLPWPDTEKLWRYWHSTERTQLQLRKRHFLGRVITPEALKLALEQSQQRQRRSAALELALQIDDYCLYSTRGLCTLER